MSAISVGSIGTSLPIDLQTCNLYGTAHSQSWWPNSIWAENPFHNGTTHILFSPLGFPRKLAALEPRPRHNLIRYHGVFAITLHDRSSENVLYTSIFSPWINQISKRYAAIRQFKSDTWKLVVFLCQFNCGYVLRLFVQSAGSRGFHLHCHIPYHYIYSKTQNRAMAIWFCTTYGAS